MSVRFINQYFSFNKIQEKHNDIVHPNRSYVRFSLSSSRKRTDTGEREYSDWFATARGDAASIVETLEHGDFIVCTGAFDRVPYKLPDGTKKWPNASIVIFELKKYIKPEDPMPDIITPESDVYTQKERPDDSLPF